MTTYQHYIDQIRIHPSQSVEGIICAGKVLLEAKNKLDRKSFIAMLEAHDCPISESTAIRLMNIARHPVLGNYSHVQNLPPHWGTLYELSKLDPKVLEANLEDGTITADIERKDVAKLLPAPKKR